jgi:hypothetical protein
MTDKIQRIRVTLRKPSKTLKYDELWTKEGLICFRIHGADEIVRYPPWRIEEVRTVWEER